MLGSHGGGYKYRLCPKTEQLTEACFQKPEHQLDFSTDYHTVLFANGPKRISNTIVREGGGIGWMVSPIPMPNFIGSDCDDMNGHPCKGCPCGSGYPGGARNEDFPNPFGKDNMGKNTAIMDEVYVPMVPPGDYVVGFRYETCLWPSCTRKRLSRILQSNTISLASQIRMIRWDCETSSQVWSSCADITIE